MMEFSNLDHQHQQDLLGGTSPLPSPPFQLLGASHDWNHNLILNGGGFNPNVNGVLSGSRESRLTNGIPSPTLNMAHMIQDLGFHWAGTAESCMNHSSVHQANMDGSKEELSHSFNFPSTSCIKNEQRGLQELDERMSMKAFPSCQTNGIQPQGREFLIDTPNFASFGSTAARGRGGYSLVLPTTDISSPNPQSMYPVSLGMDLQALDLLASARYGRTMCGPYVNNVAFLREGIPFGLGHLQNQVQEASYGHYKIPSLVSGVTETKRSNSLSEHEASQPVPKKPRLETRSPCAPFKVRKEKLGDRIAALQQLVAPFGKTDTASVLMEAIGYIKFLQDQVETLSVPYMRTFNNKKLGTSEEASSEDADEPKPDLRSRGLCLVPLACTSYVTNENGGAWSPPNYRGSN